MKTSTKLLRILNNNRFSSYDSRERPLMNDANDEVKERKETDGNGKFDCEGPY
ncbi:hypothetical protein BVAD3_22310 [Bacillus velezensis]|nr:hypothetical protein BVAD3_22310 [Bacillus velezensis]